VAAAIKRGAECAKTKKGKYMQSIFATAGNGFIPSITARMAASPAKLRKRTKIKTTREDEVTSVGRVGSSIFGSRS
jgi:hypothetical protein